MNIEEAKKLIDKQSIGKGGVGDIPVVKTHIVKVLLDQLIQPKPVVKQFMADWYEENKYDFYLNLHKLAWELIENLDEDCFVLEKAIDSDFKRWYYRNKTAIKTLINMHQFGYTVEKEKL
ncbi:hypothetical protein B8V10_05840 [Streptococcus agalactiae]|nr:hypothetical protein B2G84_03320 [Streptococcus agalactiae]AXO12018.1 DUF1642 domain-containing protein [Streptococcus agalactiae]KAA9062876.1 DUF1642 domain-containing protein [Streptococcus agalactiae]KAA9095158.1 DUF1642 domain-containing protein [Streptococcus agalactiae]KAA9113996.1 DUF1642 domain-containing protein [Streptococcus agalactiae]